MTETYMTEESIQKLIAENVAKASALSALPIPLVDSIGSVVIQVKMIEKLANIHNVRIDNRQSILISSIVTAAVTSLIALAINQLTTNTKFEKLLGEALVKATLVSITTTAMGELYHHHFKHGGTVDDLTFETVMDYIERQMSSDRLSISNLSDELVEGMMDRFG